MYATDKFICFYSRVFGTTKLKIPFSRIIKMSKKDTWGIPNAISIVTYGLNGREESVTPSLLAFGLVLASQASAPHFDIPSSQD